MRSHIDWLTFTIPMLYGEETNEAYARAIESGLVDMFTVGVVERIFGGKWSKAERSRAPYTDAWNDEQGGISLYASPNLTHCCVEISGRGCERLIELTAMDVVLAACCERITRIDLAVDIETQVSPYIFVEKVNHERMRTSGHVTSDTGDTCYVGSKKSDRYARVYRYNPPHPRSHLLRIEHVFRRDYAKKVASQIIDTSLESVAAAAGLAFGWAHEIWNTSLVDSADISVVVERGNTGNTVFWLVSSCAPAFKRLCADGTITNPEEFIKRYFLPEE